MDGSLKWPGYRNASLGEPAGETAEEMNNNNKSHI